VVSITSRPLYPRERPVTHCTEAGWAPGPDWTCAKNIAPTGFRSPDRPPRIQSLLPTELSRPQFTYVYRYKTISTSLHAVLYLYWCLLREHLGCRLCAKVRRIIPNKAFEIACIQGCSLFVTCRQQAADVRVWMTPYSHVVRYLLLCRKFTAIQLYNVARCVIVQTYMFTCLK
jgi:hypothetical protein